MEEDTAKTEMIKMILYILLSFSYNLKKKKKTKFNDIISIQSFRRIIRKVHLNDIKSIKNKTWEIKFH